MAYRLVQSAATLCAAACVSTPLLAQVDITLIDVGQGDSILITFPPLSDGSRRHMLIDGGPSTAQTGPVMEYLSDHHVGRLDWVVLTHPHNDHFNGLTEVLKQVPVDDFWWTGEGRSGGTQWENFDEAMDHAARSSLSTRGKARSTRGRKAPQGTRS